MHQKVQKTLFGDVIEVEKFDKKCLSFSKKNQKSSFKYILGFFNPMTRNVHLNAHLI
jgi:hypothetical protein